MNAKRKKKNNKIILWLGFLLIFSSLILFLAIFFPIIKSEWNYLVLPKDESVKIVLNGNSDDIENEVKNNTIIPKDKEFGIIIPKIGVNTKVFANVNSQNESEYGKKLKYGVAHAKGSGFPQDDRTVFIFAHSSSDFYRNNNFNTVFYLLRKLEVDDIFYLVYKKKLYSYKMVEKRIVTENEVSYLQDNKKYDVILMTCWPPGTSYKRLLVMGKRMDE